MLNMKLINRGTEGELLLSGRLDFDAAEEAERIMSETAQRFDSLILNLEQLDYISSAGLRVLKRVHTNMHRRGGTLAVKNVSKTIMEVFEMTGFAPILKMV